jgi:hypothetical protein
MGAAIEQFAYSFHAATDRNGFVLGTLVTPGNIHDSAVFEELVEGHGQTW